MSKLISKIVDKNSPLKTALLNTAVMEPTPKISTRYDYASIARPEVDFPKDDPNSRSLTIQSDLDSTDINKIMAKYEKTGFIVDELTGNRRSPVYGDFSDVGDYHALQNTIAKVREAFDAYPASIRNRFQNDPAELIEYLNNPENDAEAIKLGLKIDPLKTPVAETTVVTPGVPDVSKNVVEKTTEKPARPGGA